MQINSAPWSHRFPSFPWQTPVNSPPLASPPYEFMLLRLLWISGSLCPAPSLFKPNKTIRTRSNLRVRILPFWKKRSCSALGHRNVCSAAPKVLSTDRSPSGVTSMQVFFFFFLQTQVSHPKEGIHVADIARKVSRGFLRNV